MPLLTDSRRIQFAKWLDEYVAGALIAFTRGHESRARASEPPCRILVIKFWGLGSITLCEPALRYLRRAYPRARVDFLTLRQNRELFALMPHVEDVHVLEFESLWKFLRSLLRQLPHLRGQKYDLIFDAEFFANFSALLARALSPAQLVGFSRPGGRKQRLLDVAVPFEQQEHAAKNFLRLAAAARAGAAAAHDPEDFRPLLAAPRGNKFAFETPYAVINANASPLALERRWPRENFLQLARWLLHEYDANLVLIGNRAEQAYTENLASALNMPARVHNLAGVLDLRQLAGVLAGAALVISNDSGPLHLAAALQRPVAGFYGPETPQRFGPLCPKKLVLYLGLPCSPCMSIDNAKTVNCTNHLRCMRDLRADMAIPPLRAFIETHRLLPPRRKGKRLPMVANSKPRLLLLNPPGKRVYLRDYYCSKVSQADYLNHPIDLLYLSGLLRAHYELHLIDAIADKLSVPATLQRIRALQPAVIAGLIGSVSLQEDEEFYRRLAAETPAPVLLSGDVLIENRAPRLQEMDFAAAFLHDFSDGAVCDYLQGSRENLRNMTYREHGTIAAAPIVRSRCEDFELPLPAHHLFVEKDYRYPFVRRRRFATVLTEFGCPYRCTFCIMSTLGWKIRPVANVLQELDHLHKLGVRELFFLDQTFALQRPRALHLLGEMQRRAYGFGWVCFSRPDILDDELLRAMKGAGCHTLILGLESGDEAILAAVKKDCTRAQVLAGFQRCRAHGLRTVATVILGLPEETEESFQRTMEFLKTVPVDFVSFNVAVPRMGTPLRRKAIQSGLISPDFQIMDQSGREVAMPGFTLSRAQIAAMRRRAVRGFYLHAQYLKRRLLGVRSLEDAGIQLRQGLGLLRNYLN